MKRDGMGKREIEKEFEELIKEIRELRPWFIKRFAGLLIIQTGVITTIITLLR